MTDLERQADEILRRQGADLPWERGRGRDTWAAAIRAVVEALQTPAPDTFTLAEVQKMWRTGVATGKILAEKDAQ